MSGAGAGVAPRGERGLKRRLGPVLLTLYGVGVMVGAGIYVLVGAVAGEAGAWAPLAFLVAGLIAAPTAVSYGELAARLPESGGEAAYADAATGSAALAILAGLGVATVGVVSAAVVLQGGVGYLRAVLDLPAAVLATALAVSLGLAAVAGVLESLLLAAAFTAVEVVGLLIVAGAGFLGEPAVAGPAAAFPPVAGFAAAALLAFFAFLGFEDMVNMAEETHAPERTVPRAIFLALAITTALYMLVTVSAVRAVPPAELAASERPLALVFERATGRGAGFLALIAVAAALNGVLAQIVMSARVLYGLGRRTRAFAVFHHSHPRFGTPVLATAVAAGVVLALALTLPLVALANWTSLLLLAIFLAMNLALIVLKRRGRPPEGAFEAPGWVPWAGAVLSAGALMAGGLA